MDGTQAEASPSTDAGGSNSLTLSEGAEKLLPFIAEDAVSLDEETAPGAPSPKDEKAADDPVPALTDETLVALKDGSKVSIRELKRGYVSRQTFTGKTQALADERARLTKIQDAVQQRAAAVQATGKALAKVAAVLLPRRPDPSVIDSDPQTYKAQQAAFEYAAGLVAEVERASRVEHTSARAEAQAIERDRQSRQQMERQGERERLLELMPGLSKPGAYTAWWQAACQTMAGYGFTPAELDEMEDYRLYLAVNDLIRLKQIKVSAASSKTAVKKSLVAPMKGSRSISRSSRDAGSRQADSERLKRTGRLEDAAALIARQI